MQCQHTSLSSACLSYGFPRQCRLTMYAWYSGGYAEGGSPEGCRGEDTASCSRAAALIDDGREMGCDTEGSLFMPGAEGLPASTVWSSDSAAQPMGSLVCAQTCSTSCDDCLHRCQNGGCTGMQEATASSFHKLKVLVVRNSQVLCACITLLQHHLFSIRKGPCSSLRATSF